jgi:hypothetical protein
VDNEVTHVDGEFVELGQEIRVTMHPKSLKVILPVPEADKTHL